MTSPESISNIRRDLLDRPVRSYADKLQAELKDIWRSRGVHTLDDFKRLAREKKIPEAVVRQYRDLTVRLADVVRSGKLPEDAVAPEIWEIMERERSALNQFFGRDIDVPPPPPEVTPELLEFWKDNLFTIHFLPKIEMGEKDVFPGWKKKPGAAQDESLTVYKLYNGIQNGHLLKDAATLPGCWLLVDERQKPDQRADAMQKYHHDELMGNILVSRPLGPTSLPRSSDSRFGRSWEDLHHPDVVRAASAGLTLPSAMVRLPRFIEWNFLANAFYKQWDTTDTSEWFEDSIREARGTGIRTRALYGGNKCYGGASMVRTNDARGSSDALGFRWVAELR